MVATDLDFGKTGIKKVEHLNPRIEIVLIDGERMTLFPYGIIDIPSDLFCGIFRKMSSDPVYRWSSSDKSILPPLPPYVSAEEQLNSGCVTYPAWSASVSPIVISPGANVELHSQWNRSTPGTGYELWFLVESPSGKTYGIIMGIVKIDKGEVQFSETYDVVFPQDFEKANSLERGNYKVFFVEYWRGDNPQIGNYACAEFVVQ